MNSILRNAEAVKEYQSTLGEDNAAIEDVRKEDVFNNLISAQRLNIMTLIVI